MRAVRRGSSAPHRSANSSASPGTKSAMMAFSAVFCRHNWKEEGRDFPVGVAQGWAVEG